MTRPIYDPGGLCVQLRKLPRPISVNDYVNRGYPTKEKKRYLREFGDWALVNPPAKFRKALFHQEGLYEAFKANLAPYHIVLDYHWVDDFLTESKKAKEKMRKIDASNFIKCTEDCLAKWLGIDDRYFKQFTFRAEHDPDPDRHDFRVTIHAPQKFF